MKQPGPAGKFAAAFAAASLFAGSAASAAPTAMRSVDPLVAVSMLGTASSQAAVCAAGAASAAAAGAAVAAQGAQPGCVLPVVDAPPPVPVAEAPPPAYVPAVVSTGGGIGVLPLLLGLAAIVGAAALLLEDGDDEIELPLSPN